MDLSKLTGKLLELAKIADEKTGKPNNVYLEDEKEISLFLNEAEKSVQKGEISVDDVNAIFGFEKMAKTPVKAPLSDEDAVIARNYVENLSDDEKEMVTRQTRLLSDEEYSKMAHDIESMLITNEMTGNENVLNKMPEYRFDVLIQKYIDKQDKYNEVDNKVENWYRNPELPEPEQEIRTEMEDTIQKTLGMTYQEYKEAYAEELEEVSHIPPVLRGYSSMAEIIAHNEAVSNLSDSAKQVYRQVTDLNTYLYQNFRYWEKDIIYNASVKTSEMGVDVLSSMYTVEDNEYAFMIGDEIYGFEMPENWLVKKNFIEQIGQYASSVNDVTADGVIGVKTRKITNGKEVIIEKTYPDGRKECYDMQGRRVDCNEM